MSCFFNVSKSPAADAFPMRKEIIEFVKIFNIYFIINKYIVNSFCICLPNHKPFSISFKLMCTSFSSLLLEAIKLEIYLEFQLIYLFLKYKSANINVNFRVNSIYTIKYELFNIHST